MNLKKYEIFLFICILHELSECMNNDDDYVGNTSKHEGEQSNHKAILKNKRREEPKNLMNARRELLNVQNESSNKGIVIEDHKKRMFHYEFNPGVDITFDQLFPDEKSAKHFLKGYDRKHPNDQKLEGKN
uniref:Uncharacterized protein n=1 Tax=Meloidogyne enterolobii TaxID=390850 RepID=A0A6V7V6S5_MELEN|nr:unnamed protein product [Meloidogyne enterolobii]